MKEGVKRAALFILIVAAVIAFLIHDHRKYDKIVRSLDEEPIGV